MEYDTSNWWHVNCKHPKFGDYLVQSYPDKDEAQRHAALLGAGMRTGEQTYSCSRTPAPKLNMQRVKDAKEIK